MALRDLFRWRSSKPTVRAFASMSLASGPLTANTPVASSENWQPKAWRFYDVVPEMRLVVSYRGAALSKVKLEISDVSGAEPQVVDTPQTKAVLELLFGGCSKHAEALMRIAQHLTIVGETYNVVIDHGPGHGEEWLILPPDHVDRSQLFTGPDGRNVGYVRIKHPLTGADFVFQADDVNLNIMRLWNPHPHNFWDADSPTRGAISTLEKIQHYDAALNAAARSRMTGGGLLFLPQEMSLPSTSDTQDDTTPEQQFQKMIHKVISTAITNPESAEAAAPAIAWVPGEVLDKIPSKPITFWSEFDKSVDKLRETEIRRYAAGQPLPTEMVTGYGDVNHWTGWHLSEEDLKFDIAPLAELICAHFTENVVQFLLGPDYVLTPNYADLVSRPNRTPETLELFNAGGVSRGELRVAAGYPEEWPEHEPDPLDALQVQARDSLTVPAVRADTVAPGPPDQALLTQSGDYAAADMLARDLLCTAGQWMLTHVPRPQRAAFSAVAVLDRHVQVKADGKAWDKAYSSAQEKYAGVVEDSLFTLVADHVRGLLLAQQPYDPSGLRACVRDVSCG